MYLKISKFLENLAFKLRQKSLYYELKNYIIKDKNYIKPVYEFRDRCIGKTYTLIQLAYKYKCPIITPTIQMAKYIEKIAAKMNKPVEVFGCSTCRLRGKTYNLVLCEEGIDDSIIDELIRPMCKQIVGYKAIHY